MISRFLENKVIEALKAFRGIYIYGPRQSGKTTFVKDLADKLNISYVSLDEPQVYQIATSFPESFFDQFKPPIVIDEIQLAPPLISVIKLLLDNTDKKGQIILTGSSDFRKSKNIRESLVGRVVGYELYPFSVREISGSRKSILEMFFSGDFDFGMPDRAQSEIVKHLCIGGFPEIVLSNTTIEQRRAWFKEYTTGRILRDLETLDNIRGKNKILNLLGRLSWQAGSLINFSHLASEDISRITVAKYFDLLEALFLVEVLLPFWRNIGKRFVKMPKVYFTDTGLLCYLLGVSEENLLAKPELLGKVFENFIYTELKKQISFATSSYDLFFFRDNKKNEVDFVLQNSQGQLVAIEVKAKTRLKDDDFKGLKVFSTLFPEARLYVVYLGNHYLKYRFDDKSVIVLPAKVFFG